MKSGLTTEKQRDNEVRKGIKRMKKALGGVKGKAGAASIKAPKF
ncbi:hypothetical protein LCGC14_0683680 [marine sediment metagenome]|uniref:Uncharacterized protein n=1 Tax=marine sediment metagenome TaxID=412755 RepID=A0A0F9R7T3_9ZZZZ